MTLAWIPFDKELFDMNNKIWEARIYPNILTRVLAVDFIGNQSVIGTILDGNGNEQVSYGNPDLMQMRLREGCKAWYRTEE